MKYHWNWYTPIHQELINPMDSLIFCRLCSGFSSISAGCEDLRSWKERGTDLCGWELVTSWVRVILGRRPRLSKSHLGWFLGGPSWAFSVGTGRLDCEKRARASCLHVRNVSCHESSCSHVSSCSISAPRWVRLTSIDWKESKSVVTLCLEFLPMVILICRDSLCLRVPVRQTRSDFGLATSVPWKLGPRWHWQRCRYWVKHGKTI